MRKLALVMFTDIEGYTALMQTDEPAAIQWIDKHRMHFEYCMQKYHGNIIQYFGDGTLSIFDSALMAVRSAIELQQLLRSEHPVIPLRVGMHLGEIMLHEHNIIGDAVNVASRIESLAISGSILISSRVNEELKNQQDIKSKRFGSFHFKNISERLEVFAIIAPGVVSPSEYHYTAKLSTGEKARNFPRYSQAFIGRKKELAELTEMVLQPTTRLVTILGAGGLGKTRLAAQVGQQLAKQFEGGAFYIPLDSVDDPLAIDKAIGTILGLREQGNVDWHAKLISHLKYLEILLVLDNFEHLLAGKWIIKNILDQCPEVNLLITSRSNLNLATEKEFHLHALPVPTLKQDVSLVEISENESITLFVQKAKQVRPNFSLDMQNRDVLAKICQELEGLPLAIELAASRIKLLSPAQILAKLEDLFSLLKTSRATQQKKHQTILETIRWSYDLLNDEEKAVFRYFSIFNVHFSLEAAQALIPDMDAFDAIESLINKSLLYIDESTDKETRFSMLRVIREYGQKKLAEIPSELTQVQNMYADYYLNYLRDHEYKREWIKISDWLHKITLEIENIRQVAKLFQKHSPRKFRSFTGLHWRYYLLKGFMREGLEMAQAAIEAERETKDELQGKLLIAAGTFAQNLSAFRDACSLFSQALPIFIEEKNQQQLCITLNNLGWAEFRLGNFEKSDSYSQNALDLAKEQGQIEYQATALNNFAWVAKFRGDSEKALALFDQAFQLQESLGNEHGKAFCLVNKGWSLIDLVELTQARAPIEEAIEYYAKIGDRQLLTFSKTIESLLLENAESVLFEEVIPTFTDIGDTWGLGLAYQFLADHFLAKEDPIQADKLIQQSLNIRNEIDDRWGICNCHLRKARIFLNNQNFFESHRHLNHADVLADQMNSPGQSIEIFSMLGELNYLQDRFEESSKKFSQALDLMPFVPKRRLTIFLAKYQEHLKQLQLEEKIPPF